MNDNSTNSAISNDLLFGAGKIAEFLFGDMKHRRRIYHLTNEATNGIPHFKIGQATCASKRTILRWIAKQEEQNGATPPALELARDKESRMSRRIIRALWHPIRQRWRWWKTTRAAGTRASTRPDRGG